MGIVFLVPALSQADAMSAGAENRLHLTLASGLAVLGVILLGRVIAGWVDSGVDRRSSATESNIRTKATGLNAFDPTLRRDLLDSAKTANTRAQ